MSEKDIEELLADADRIVATDLYPARFRTIIADMAAALRKEPPVKVRFTWASDDQEFWLHMELPDGKAAGINLGNPKTMIASACLRALAGNGGAK